ncbi:MAG: SPOR domain-containing protein [Kiloniellaceae bacterium]
MLQRHGLPAPAAALILGAALLLLGGCQGIYDNTKGWANRLEASILETARDISADEAAPDTLHTAPETGGPRPPAAARGNQMAGLNPLPRPEGTPVPILSDEGDEGAPGYDLLPSEANGEISTAAATLATEPAPSADAAPGAQTKTAEAQLPPLPRRKPKGAAKPGMGAKPATAAKPGDAVAMVLHLSSLRSEKAAKREWSDLQSAFPDSLGSMAVEIRRTELGDKGTFYRVLAGPLPSKAAARKTCAEVKAKNAKQYCSVMAPQPQS